MSNAQKHETEQGTKVSTPEVIQAGFDAEFMGKVVWNRDGETTKGNVKHEYVLVAGEQSLYLTHFPRSEREMAPVGSWVRAGFVINSVKGKDGYRTYTNATSLVTIEVTEDTTITLSL